MALTKKVTDEIAPKVEETTASPEDDFVYVTVPEKDMTGHVFHGIGHNLDFYKPGVHKVRKDVGKELEERLRIMHEADLKIYSSQINPELRKLLSARGINLGE